MQQLVQHWHATVTYCAVFWTFGLCVAVITARDTRRRLSTARDHSPRRVVRTFDLCVCVCVWLLLFVMHGTVACDTHGVVFHGPCKAHSAVVRP